MKESITITKEANAKKVFSDTMSDKSIHRVQHEPERQLGSLRSVIGNIRRDGGTPSVDSIATELSSVHTAQRAPVLLALQQTHGNRYVQGVVAGIQAKLKVGQPGDIYEQEADRVADEVMRMAEPRLQLQEKEEEEKLLQVKQSPDRGSEVTPNLEAHINAIRGSGQPLPAAIRAFFEPRFGYDFSQVRVHTDAEADMLNRALNAHAFTTGQDMFFRQGVYNPSSSSGQELLAHELTHVVQQRAASRFGEVVQRNDRTEERTEREIESDRRRRREEGGRDRRRWAGGDFESDWAGRALVHRYLTGGGDWTITNDQNWSRYMKANESLRSILRTGVLRLAQDAFSGQYSTEEVLDIVSESFHVEIENGEGIIGYQYLHGTNVNAGDFQIIGTTTRISDMEGVTVRLDLSYTWNDIIDPNPIYWTDRLKSAFAELITLGMAEGYTIHITWNAEAVVRFDDTGQVASITGWPFD